MKRNMARILVLCMVILLVGCSKAQEQQVSTSSSDSPPSSSSSQTEEKDAFTADVSVFAQTNSFSKSADTAFFRPGKIGEEERVVDMNKILFNDMARLSFAEGTRTFWTVPYTLDTGAQTQSNRIVMYDYESGRSALVADGVFFYNRLTDGEKNEPSKTNSVTIVPLAADGDMLYLWEVNGLRQQDECIYALYQLEMSSGRYTWLGDFPLDNPVCTGARRGAVVDHVLYFNSYDASSSSPGAEPIYEDVYSYTPTQGIRSIAKETCGVYTDQGAWCAAVNDEREVIFPDIQRKTICSTDRMKTIQAVDVGDTLAFDFRLEAGKMMGTGLWKDGKLLPLLTTAKAEDVYSRSLFGYIVWENQKGVMQAYHVGKDAFVMFGYTEYASVTGWATEQALLFATVAEGEEKDELQLHICTLL